MADVVLAVDLGVTLHVAVLAGPAIRPEVWCVGKVVWRVPDEWPGVRAYLDSMLITWEAGTIVCEQTFSAGASLPGRRDVGRSQEAQATRIDERYGERVRVLRVQPVTGQEARRAWEILGRPNPRSEHYRDAYSCGLKGLIRLEGERIDEKRRAAGAGGGKDV